MTIATSAQVSAPSTTPFIVAHRGASGLHPESTLRAFDEALKMDGVHGICLLYTSDAADE